MSLPTHSLHLPLAQETSSVSLAYFQEARLAPNFIFLVTFEWRVQEKRLEKPERYAIGAGREMFGRVN